eukprot:4065381-Amphidinium_carterae.1
MEAPWINALCERHGAVVGEVLRITTDICQLEGYQDMKLGATFACKAKNRRPTASGRSARERVFGIQEHFSGSIVEAMEEGENLAEIQRGADVVHDRAQEVREGAMKALLELDCSDRWRRLLSGAPRGQTQTTFEPGSQVYFWRRARTTANLKGRRARLAERWHGPCFVLANERQSRLGGTNGVWLAHHGYLLLVPPEHVRSATFEERLAQHEFHTVVRDFHQQLVHEQDQTSIRYWDLT